MAMIYAAMYARVSSTRQKRQETIESQVAALREHAAGQGWEIPAEWVFIDEGCDAGAAGSGTAARSERAAAG
jgi:DNA invertase Pin-like site-specific DNA recombinase